MQSVQKLSQNDPFVCPSAGHFDLSVFNRKVSQGYFFCITLKF